MAFDVFGHPAGAALIGFLRIMSAAVREIARIDARMRFCCSHPDGVVGVYCDLA